MLPLFRKLTVILFLAIGTSLSQAAIHYVDDDAPTGQNGSSWQLAHKYLQDALAAVQPGDQIWVAEGTYKPDQGASATPFDRNSTFLLVDTVHMYGSFAGSESDPNERDIENHPTILTGDLVGDDDNDPNHFSNNSDNAYHVVTIQDPNIILDGFTITRGHADGSSGAGIFSNVTASVNEIVPEIQNCTFIENLATGKGGGMYVEQDSWAPVIRSCVFRNNQSGRGGAVGLLGNYNDIEILNCDFFQNTSYKNIGGGGGGIFSYQSDFYKSKLIVSSCRFRENLAQDFNAPITGGGAILSHGSNDIFSSEFVANNSTTQHGAIYTSGYKTLIDNCIFSSNYAQYYYGVGRFSSDVLVIKNSTFTGNHAYEIGGFRINGNAEIKNSIFWNNTSTPEFISVNFGQQIVNSGSFTLFNNNCIIRKYPDEGGVLDEDFVADGNIEIDPLFVRDPNHGGDGWGVGLDDYGDVRLRSDSPCIDAGSLIYNPMTPNAGGVDLDGKSRIAGIRSDMGAYEYTPTLVELIPDGSEVWSSGSVREITWRSSGVDGPVDLFFSSDGGNVWQYIDFNVPNTGSYLWTLPFVVFSDQCLVSVTASSLDPSIIYFEQTEPFTMLFSLPGSAVASDWPNLHGPDQRIGASDFSGPDYACIKWEFQAGDDIINSVTLGENGQVFIGSSDGKLYSLDPNGNELWQYDAGSPLTTEAALSTDGSLVIGSENGNVYVVDKNGNIRWTHKSSNMPLFASPVIDDADRIFLADFDGKFSALDIQGNLLWEYVTPGFGKISNSFVASPSIGLDGSVLAITSHPAVLYSFQPDTGAVNWTREFYDINDPNEPDPDPSKCSVSPVVGGDGTIYISLASDPHLHAIDPATGLDIWASNMKDNSGQWFPQSYHDDYPNSGGWSEVALADDGTIYVSFDDPYLRSVDPNGNINWVERIGQVGGFTMTIGQDDMIYAASDDHSLYMIDSQGVQVSVLDRFGQDDYLEGPIHDRAKNYAELLYPVINSDGTLYVTQRDGSLLALTNQECEGRPYELHSLGDINKDFSVTLLDFVKFDEQWNECLEEDAEYTSPCDDFLDYFYDGSHSSNEVGLYPGQYRNYLEMDLNRDHSIDILDLAIFSEFWLISD